MLPPSWVRTSPDNLYLRLQVYREGWSGTTSQVIIALGYEGQKLGQLRLPYDSYASDDLYLGMDGTLYEMRGTKQGLEVGVRLFSH